MIYTRFGSKVSKVLGGDMSTGEIDIIIDYEDGKQPVEKNTYIHELNADNGIQEIDEAIQQANNSPKTFGGRNAQKSE